MATYLLKVSLAAQAKSMSRWNASAQMIWWYWQQQHGQHGPMHTLPGKWETNTGLAVSVADFIRLAMAAGLKPVPRQHDYNNGDLVWLLTRFGPIWCAGQWYGFGHVIVLTGVDGKTVHNNDSDGGVKKTGAIHWVNERMMNHLKGCLMYKIRKRIKATYFC